MSITTYTELKTEIATWLDRTDLTSQIPGFIELAEASMNRALRTFEMETRSQATATAEYLALPADFLSIREIHLESSPDKPLEYMSPQHMKGTIAAGETGIPGAYTLVDNQIQLAPVPSGSNTVEIIYYQKIPALTASNASNWILASHPDLYLYASLRFAEQYLMNDERSEYWSNAAAGVIMSIQSQDKKKRIGSTPLIPRVTQVV